ncbi:MAG: SDR family oxidoreductase [Terracidiphilus sp.]
MEDEFAGLVAVVTGAAQGIGRAIAGQLHARGARLVLVDCNAAGVAAAAESMRNPTGAAVSWVVADLARPERIKALAADVAALEPNVHVVVNNAGIELDMAFEEITAELFDRVIAVNLRAPLLVSQALAPLFPSSGGAIVNISSIHADHAFPNAIPYACSKAGLMALTRNLALELANRHIRVNAVCPGYIDTPMWEEWLRTARDPEALAGQTAALHPLGRRGVPEDVASAAVYLASPQATWVTGTSLVVDGGLTIRTHP